MHQNMIELNVVGIKDSLKNHSQKHGLHSENLRKSWNPKMVCGHLGISYRVSYIVWTVTEMILECQ